MQLEFKDKTTGTNVPRNFIAAIELVSNSRAIPT